MCLIHESKVYLPLQHTAPIAHHSLSVLVVYSAGVDEPLQLIDPVLACNIPGIKLYYKYVNYMLSD